ncbi:unnamed protein product [Ceutorhynchus assimilis]|uniref:Uncharacterized protein n=1 Tax=Ceutorhynchus assimilis TaxID=467358 RepID=A0A9N9MLB7_9CUCU|nr:unnamed protein product [Ceutorhynchus assimilis]
MDDKNLNDIYEKGINSATIASKLYILGLFGVIFQYVTNPLIHGPSQQVLGNKTIIVKPLPLSLWSPFDDQKYYIIAYLRHMIDGTIAISFLGYTDILIFTLIAYPVGQLKILNYLLKHFETYKQKYKKLHNMADENKAAYFLCLDNIVKHKNIIMYVKHFNETMSGLMVLEFFHFSLEIAAMCIQTVANDFSPAIMLFVADGFISLIVRLFLYYYYANEVIVLSQELAISIYKSNWYDQSPKVKFMMQIFIARAQIPLSYTIGPFSDMSLDSMIAILKATYTYIMLMYNTR